MMVILPLWEGIALQSKNAVISDLKSEQLGLLPLYSIIPVETKHLYNICTMLAQRRRRWADVVQRLYKCFVFTGIDVTRPGGVVLYAPMERQIDVTAYFSSN